MCKAIGKVSKERWKDPDHRAKVLPFAIHNVTAKRESSESNSDRMKKRWEEGDIREKVLEARRKQWEDLDFRNMMSTKAVERLQDPNNDFGYFKNKEAMYKGIRFRSSWEVDFAMRLDELDIAWKYESKTFKLADGRRYTPDFYLPKLDIFIEIKPDCFIEDSFHKTSQVPNLIVITEENWDSQITKLTVV